MTMMMVMVVMMMVTVTMVRCDAAVPIVHRCRFFRRTPTRRGRIIVSCSKNKSTVTYEASYTRSILAVGLVSVHRVIHLHLLIGVFFTSDHQLTVFKRPSSVCIASSYNNVVRQV